MSAALEQNFAPSPFAKQLHHGFQINLAAVGGAPDNLDALSGVSLASVRQIAHRSDEYRAGAGGFSEHLRSRRCLEAPINDDANGIAAASCAAGEPRVVGDDGAGAHDDRVALAAPSMDHRARSFRADPLRISSGGRD